MVEVTKSDLILVLLISDVLLRSWVCVVRGGRGHVLYIRILDNKNVQHQYVHHMFSYDVLERILLTILYIHVACGSVRFQTLAIHHEIKFSRQM
jgi:hypothetical protein